MIKGVKRFAQMITKKSKSCFIGLTGIGVVPVVIANGVICIDSGVVYYGFES